MAQPLIFGASGLLGQHLMDLWYSCERIPVGTCSGREPFPWLVPFDLSDPEALRRKLKRVRLDTVLLAAAMTDVDECERDPARAERINAKVPGVVAEACASQEARLIYFSTDFVFDGTAASVTEEDTPNPLGVYGRTKLEGERAVRAVLPDAIIIRTCANFGWNRLEPRENLVTGILNKLRRGETTPLCTDQWVAPSYAVDVAKYAHGLTKDRVGGLFHIACRSCLSLFDVGREICKVFGLPEELLKETTMAETTGPAKRLVRSCLMSDNLEERLQIWMPSFRDCLVDMKKLEGNGHVDEGAQAEPVEPLPSIDLLLRRDKQIRELLREATGVKRQRRRDHGLKD